MAEGLDTAGKTGELWVEEHNITAATGRKRTKSKEEKRLLRKMDFAIVPLLTLTFFIAYLVLPSSYEHLTLTLMLQPQGPKQLGQRSCNGHAG